MSNIDPSALCPFGCDAQLREGGHRDEDRYHCPRCMRCAPALTIASAAYERGLAAGKAAEQLRRLHCWHCGDAIAESVPQCENCLDECDNENCDAAGCRAALKGEPGPAPIGGPKPEGTL